MNIVKENPKPWKVSVSRNEDGSLCSILEKTSEEAEQMDNVVFEGKLKYIGHQRTAAHSVHHLFEDVSGVLLRFSPSTMEAFVKSIAAGTTKRLQNGRFEGLYTFATFAGYIFAIPLSEKDARLLEL